MNETNFLLTLESDYNNSLSNSLFLSSKIRTLNKESEFIKNVLLNTNTSINSESEFFNSVNEQIALYENALKINNHNLTILQSQKNKQQNFLYDKSKGYLKTFLNLRNEKDKRLFIGVEKDNNVYITIDKRQNITKSDLSLFLRKLYLKGIINKNEYRKAIKHNVLSENVRNRLNLYLSHVLAKTSHKKHLLSNNRANRYKYEFNPISKCLIKFRSFAPYFEEDFINKEILNKIKAENQIYIYHKA